MPQKETTVDDTHRAEVLVQSQDEATVWREGEWFIAQARGVEVASQGRTRVEAIANLREALELHYSWCRRADRRGARKAAQRGAAASTEDESFRSGRSGCGVP